MDLIKIGKFIATKRKDNNLTQSKLAEKLNITDRAISKWECGRALPDANIMLELCNILKINVNELLTGEEIKMDNYNKKSEDNLMDLIKQKEEADKRLLNLEIVFGLIGTIFYLAIIFIAIFIDMPVWLRFVLIFSGLALFFICALFLIRIEQKAGYYECNCCHHRYIPTYKQTLFAMHYNRTRYLKCPNCGKKSWNKKLISKE
ncbi:MAG: helix-turn-helix domain-containing protein [Acholeplasmatales bacterium]|nr:helix-turn-helix domain-containing protein [Acholeplasmatales bacterium]